MKKISAVVLVIAMLFSFAACAAPAPSTPETEASPSPEAAEKNLAVCIGSAITTLDPAANISKDVGNIELHFLETLLITDENSQLQPGQAEKYEVSQDGLTWTFTLRDGLMWADGTALTASDFVYSWKRLCDPKINSPYAETCLGMVEGYSAAIAGAPDKLGVSAPDDKTLVVKLGSPCSYFDSIVAFNPLSPVQQSVVEANGEAWGTSASTYCANGAFYLESWTEGQQIVLKKNPYFRSADKVKLDSITFSLTDDETTYNAYEAGDLLLEYYCPIEKLDSLAERPDFYTSPIISTQMTIINADSEQFSDARVRKALSLAIDRNYISQTIMQGISEPATGLVGPGWKDTDGTEFIKNANGGAPYIDVNSFEENLAQAKSLLAEAGYPNGEGFPTITYLTSTNAHNQATAEYLKQAWEKLGLTVEIDGRESSDWINAMYAGDYSIARFSWVGDYADPSNILDLFVSTNGNNVGKYNNAEYDSLAEQATAQTDAAERSKLLHSQEDMLMEDCFVIPIVFNTQYWLQSDKLIGSWYTSGGYWNFIYADIAE